MGKTLTNIAQQLISADKKVQLIYAFNGTGKTRLSGKFKQLVESEADDQDNIESDDSRFSPTNILYYNAFTEDLFYWDNSLTFDAGPKLKIQPNFFTQWVLRVQGQDQNIISNFQRYTNHKLNPKFSSDFSEVTFSYARGNDESSEKIKISKGEESNFIWSFFYSLLTQAIAVRDVAEFDERETDQFDLLEYVFIDDPVSSLDENHLIELAVDLAHLIKLDESNLKFIITTHNPLFYNVLYNEFKKDSFKKYLLKKLENEEYELELLNSDSPFSYHLYLLTELKKGVQSGHLSKYHFNFLRNILEKTSTFMGYEKWGDLLPQLNDGKPNPYESRIINISSHSKHSNEEVAELSDTEKLVLGHLVRHIHKIYKPDLTDH